VVVMRLSLTTAKASTTEEPREGKLHAGICTGGVGPTGVPTVTALRFDINAQRRIEFGHVYIQMHSGSYSSFTVTYLAGRAIAWMNIAHSLRKPSQPCCEGFFNVKKLSDVLWNIKLMPKPGALG
jgi:hypothetical protein